MKVKVTTEIEEMIYLQFRICKDPDKPSMKVLLEAGMIEFLKTRNAVAGLDMEIERARQVLSDLEASRSKMRILEPAQNRMQEFEEKDTTRQARIEDWLNEQESGSIRMIRQGSANWKRIAPEIGAATPQQAREWIMGVVKSWQAKHENGVTS